MVEYLSHGWSQQDMLALDPNLNRTLWAPQSQWPTPQNLPIHKSTPDMYDRPERLQVAHLQHPPPPHRSVVDHTSFPHIMDQIISTAPTASLLVLRSTSRHFRARINAMLFRHSRVESSAHFLQAATVPLCIPWDDMATTHIAVLDTSFDALHLAPSQTLLPDVQPKLLRFDLPGILPSSNLPSLGTIRAPIAVVFVAPHALTEPVVQPGADDIVVSDAPGMPPPQQWREGWMSHGFIPPSIISAAPFEEVATERIVYNFRVHPHHAAFALWEVDFFSPHCPDIYLLFTPDLSPLPSPHAVPAQHLSGLEGRILNRAILSLARHVARHWDRALSRHPNEKGLRIHFVGAETWDHAWLGRSFVDKDAYIDVDEEGLAEDAGMRERIMFWMDEAFESQ